MMNTSPEHQYNRISKILREWSERTQETYEEKKILSPTRISTDGEMIVILSNKVTLINESQTVITEESGPFKHNLNDISEFENRLHEFIKNFDKQFYQKISEKKDELGNNDSGFTD